MNNIILRASGRLVRRSGFADEISRVKAAVRVWTSCDPDDLFVVITNNRFALTVKVIRPETRSAIGLNEPAIH